MLTCVARIRNVGTTKTALVRIVRHLQIFHSVLHAEDFERSAWIEFSNQIGEDGFAFFQMLDVLRWNLNTAWWSRLARVLVLVFSRTRNCGQLLLQSAHAVLTV